MNASNTVLGLLEGRLASAFSGGGRRCAAAVTAMCASLVVCASLAFSATATAQPGSHSAAEVNTAVADGVAYLRTQQNPDGSFGTSFPGAETAFAIASFGVLSGGQFSALSAADQTRVSDAVDFLIGQQDSNGDFAPGTGVDNYTTGLALTGLSLNAGASAAIPAAITAGRSYLISGQAAPPAVTGNPNSLDCSSQDGQPNSDQYCGGWTYEKIDSAFADGDESNTGFALTGLELTGGVPAASAAVNVGWQRHVQEISSNITSTRNDGGGSYIPGCDAGIGGSFCSNSNDTGSLIFGYAYDDVPASDPGVAAAIAFGHEALDQMLLNASATTPVRTMVYHTGTNFEQACEEGSAGCNWFTGSGEGSFHYSLFGLSKGLGQYETPDLTDANNFYAEVVDLLLGDQQPDGSWLADGRDDGGSQIVATGFSILALGKVGQTVTGKISARGTFTDPAAGSVQMSAVTNCLPASSTRPFQVRWTGGGSFTKTSVTTSTCSVDPALPVLAGRPNTQEGTAAGTLNGGGSGTISWTFKDGGAGGVAADKVAFTIRNSSNVIVKQVNEQSAGTLFGTPGGVWTAGP